MVGPFGEVTVMDWGLARQLRTPVDAAERPRSARARRAPGGCASRPPAAPSWARVLGTPLYMSPEQARGEHDVLDARSDIYSLCVLFHELLFLRHYLEGRESLAEILQGVQTVTPEVDELSSTRTSRTCPLSCAGSSPGASRRIRRERYASVDAMVKELQRS